MPRAMTAMSTSDAARPSRPSTMFTALSTPTVEKTVRGMASGPKDSRLSGITR